MKKQSHNLNPEDEKYAQGAVITFQKDPEEDKNQDKLPSIERRRIMMEDEEEEDQPIDAIYPDEVSDLQEAQRNNRIIAFNSMAEDEDKVARELEKENAKFRK